ncbi:DODA-type extradiol aromatic ring-opening family dioxygenase [Anaerococcus porci]|nr:class III extradiol ring-cleavage dioxygenase [Anaerococcus porci]
MYGFPKELYEVKYHVNGDHVLTDKILNLLKNDDIKLNQQWGIDHGTWTVLVHMFPEADIPVVQLSVNASIGEREVFKIGKKLKDLRDEGYLILGSGNIVHNLRYVDWEKKDASLENREFDKFIVENVLSKNFENVINYDKNPYSSYAVPSKDHFYPLIYVLGASDNDKVEVFNQVGSLASISMTSFIFK